MHVGVERPGDQDRTAACATPGVGRLQVVRAIACAPLNVALPPASLRPPGNLGGATIRLLGAAGYPVSCWTRSPRQEVPGATRCYYGRQQLREFASQADVVVNLVPLTKETRCVLSPSLRLGRELACQGCVSLLRSPPAFPSCPVPLVLLPPTLPPCPPPVRSGILNAEFFSWLPRGTCLVNVSRGQHVVDADLLAALDDGQLALAVLDVFHEVGEMGDSAGAPAGVKKRLCCPVHS